MSRLVTYNRKKDHWQLRTGPFAEDEFPKLGKRDWTLLVQDMDKWDMDVRALLDRFRFLPRWRIDDVMISFATPGGSVGAARRPVRRLPAAGAGPASLADRR